MSKLWHALPVLLVGATLLAPVAPASAGWSCSYYRWESGTQRWVLVARLQPQDDFRRTHVLGVDYDCEYCYVPAVPRRPDDPLGTVDDVQVLADTAVHQVQELSVPIGPGSPAPMNPWDGPECPLVPPVWDELGVAPGPIG